MSTRHKAEAIFSWIGKTSAVHPWRYIALSVLLLVISLWQLTFLEIDTTTEGFLRKDDPSIIEFNAFKQEFGRDVQFIISVESDRIFSTEFVQQFKKLHADLERNVPYVDQVDSLVNARDIYGADGELVVQDFFQELPASEQDWQQKKNKALAHPFYKNVYLSTDGKMVNIYVRPAVNYAHTDEAIKQMSFSVLKKMVIMYVNPQASITEKLGDKVKYDPIGEVQIHEMILSIQKVLGQYPAIGKKVSLSGTPVLADELSYYLVRDMLKFIGLALFVIACVLFFLFRSWWGIVLPLVVVSTALLSTMALMSATGQPIQSPTVILPSFILAVGISDSIHLMSAFVMRMREGASKLNAIEYALGHCGVPILFTILTTAAGLFSFGGSDILPVANLGWFSAAGVFFAFVYTVVFLPALLAITPISIKPRVMKSRHTFIDAFIAFSCGFSKRRTRPIILATAVVALLSLYGASQLQFSHDPIKWLPDNSPVRLSMEKISEKIGGTVPVEIVLDTGVADGIKDPDFLKSLDEVVGSMESFKTDKLAVGKVVAVTTLIKETNMALYDNDPAAYIIPDNRELIAQELLMLESAGAKDLQRLVDGNYQKVRITVLTPWVDALYFGDYINGLNDMLKKKFEGKASIQVTGIVPMLSKTLKKIMKATAVSYVFAFVVITFMMIMLLGSVKYGLISVLPNVLPITMVLALMHVTGAPLDMFSILIGSIAMGLAVDDTVHFMDGFRTVYQKTGNAELAISETLNVSGRAMLSTGLVLSLGFLIYLFSPMHNLEDFGMYSAICILVAMLADFWITPALLLVLHRKK